MLRTLKPTHCQAALGEAEPPQTRCTGTKFGFSSSVQQCGRGGDGGSEAVAVTPL